MISISVKANSRLGKISEAVTKGGARAVRQLAEAAIETVVEEIDARIQPSGAAQKRNAVSTIRRKGHDHPLVETGLLRRAVAWQIRDAGPSSVVVSPPDGRDGEVAKRLVKLGYRFNEPLRSARFARRRGRTLSLYTTSIERGR